jgi:hypothetical protein
MAFLPAIATAMGASASTVAPTGSNRLPLSVMIASLDSAMMLSAMSRTRREFWV